MSSITKKCSKCRKEKNLTDFPNDFRLVCGKKSYCKVCFSSQNKEYREKNKDRYKATKRVYYLSHKEEVIKKAHDWYINNIERVKINQTEHRRRNAERYRELQKIREERWKTTNPIGYKNSRDSWRKKNPFKGKEYHNARRAREEGVGGRITDKEWKDLLEKYGNKCLCCNRTDVALALDHVVPIISGGANVIGNAQPLCKSCNSKKGTKTIDFR